VDGPGLAAVAEEVFAAACFGAVGVAEHGDGVAEDVADVEVSARVAFEDGAAGPADGDLAFERGSEVGAACCGAATAGP